MKGSILTFSQTGNTNKVALAIGQGISETGNIKVEHTRFLKRKRWQPQNADFIGIGCPCFESRPAEIVPDFLKNEGFDFSGKTAFVFITSSSSPAKTLWRLAQAVERTGAKVVGGIQITAVSTAPSMFGLTPDRPNQQDYVFAQEFGRALANKLVFDKPLQKCFHIDPRRGSAFYDFVGSVANIMKKKSIPPPNVNHQDCTLCGNCAFECPLDNIHIKNKIVRVGQDCTVCWRCWHVCPTHALNMKPTVLNGVVEHLLWSEKLERFFGELKPGQNRGPNLYRDAFTRRVRLKYDRKNPTADYYYVDQPGDEKAKKFPAIDDEALSAMNNQ